MKKKLLFAGSEVMPFAATGGLGDVLGSLPEALAGADKELDVRVVMPLYSTISHEWREKMTFEKSFYVRLAWRVQYCGIFSLVKNRVTYYFIDNEYYFRHQGLYGFYDDGERYAYFSAAIVAMMPQLGWYPDIFHANDWQTAPAVIYLNRARASLEYCNMRTVFTIHNIAFQGEYDLAILGDVFDLRPEEAHLVELNGCINLMKGAIVTADAVTTVSPTYAREIMTEEYGKGLQAILQENAYKVRGILNGIDYVYYNPWTDAVLPKKYSAGRPSGKNACRTAMRAEVGLPDTGVPLMALISRLTAQKGLDIVEAAIRGILRDTQAQLIVLGKGDAEYENFFRNLEQEFPDQVRALLIYDRELSKRVYAAADIFLMPSKTEPCGLSQMIASRYGAIPVVRETGGLADSIHCYYEKDGEMFGNGFTFYDYRADTLYYAVHGAVGLWNDKEKRKKIVQTVMTADFTWHTSAKEYLKLYTDILK